MDILSSKNFMTRFLYNTNIKDKNVILSLSEVLFTCQKQLKNTTLIVSNQTLTISRLDTQLKCGKFTEISDQPTEMGDGLSTYSSLVNHHKCGGGNFDTNVISASHFDALADGGTYNILWSVINKITP